MSEFRVDEDSLLFQKFQQGDESAFEQLIEKYKNILLNYLYNFTGEKNTAEDLLSEVFLRIYRAAKFYQPRAKFSTCLWRVATNIGRDWRKKIHPAIISLDDLNSSEQPAKNFLADQQSFNPEKLLLGNEQQKIIRQAILSLPEKQRLALILKVYENRSYREIAAILGTSVSAVETLLFRARQNLKAKLSPQVF